MSKMDLRHSVGIRLIIVAVLTIILMIPAQMIRSLITERQARRDQVASEINSNWGGEQVLIGPILNVPFKVRNPGSQDKDAFYKQVAHFLPDKLDFTGRIEPEQRNRGIYNIMVYNANLNVSASFARAGFDEMHIGSDDVLWDDATVSFGLSDMKGLKEPLTFTWNGANVEAGPGAPTTDQSATAMSIPVKLAPGDDGYQFATALNLNGSHDLSFSPVGAVTEVHLTSDWTNPSFSGDFLPTDREIDKSGFKADWKVLEVNRGYPKMWIGSSYQANRPVFGVSLLLPVNQYQETMRTVKYSVMFIALTFLTFFIIEILSGKPIHPIQYLLVGLALLVFYTLLLSLSEYISFGYAYLIACIGIIGMITIYSSSFLADKFKSAIVALILVILYGYLYIILQLQDYSLLMGSVILFIALAMMMFLTRKIDWFSVLNSGQLPDSQQTP